MSRFFSNKYSALEPYVPGEQPSCMSEYVKLNTNESPFPPSKKAMDYALNNTRALNLYSDPDSVELSKAIADTYNVKRNMVLLKAGIRRLKVLLKQGVFWPAYRDSLQKKWTASAFW